MDPKTYLDIVVIDDDLEALALRSALEWWGVQVTLHRIGQAKDLVSLLSGSRRISKTIFLMCHGNYQGLLLPELHSDLEKSQPYHGALTPAHLAEFMYLPDCVLISTGCATGTSAFADAFSAAGCRAYIGPAGYPNGDAVLFYTLHLCYEWICKGQPLKEAHQRATAHDEETGMFRLYTKG
jgi:hypothetical protein